MNQSRTLFATLFLLSVSLGVSVATSTPTHRPHASTLHRRSRIPPKQREEVTTNKQKASQKAADQEDQFLRQ
jgi:hypothetical protein